MIWTEKVLILKLKTKGFWTWEVLTILLQLNKIYYEIFPPFTTWMAVNNKLYVFILMFLYWIKLENRLKKFADNLFFLQEFLHTKVNENFLNRPNLSKTPIFMQTCSMYISQNRLVGPLWDLVSESKFGVQNTIYTRIWTFRLATIFRKEEIIRTPFLTTYSAPRI